MKDNIKFKNLDVEILSNNGSTHLLLSGSINESFDYPKIKVPNKNKVIIDLGKVDQCNSYGARQWIFFLRDLIENVEDITLQKCSITMMDQFNIAPQMTFKAKLDSCYAPYYCPTCDEEIVCLIDRQLHNKALSTGEIPSIKHSCQTILEFDALTPDYFKLLK